MKTFVTLLFTVLFMTPGYAQKAKLSLNLEQDKTYKHVTHSKATINQDVYGMKMNIEITMDASMSFHVKAVTKEGYDMELRYDWMNMTMVLPQTTMEFSSEKNDESDLFSSILGELKEIPLKMKMDHLGKIAELEDVESLWDSVITQFSQFPLEQRQQVKSQLMNSYGNNAITGTVETVTAIYPEKPVKEGAQWNIITNLKAGMSSTHSTTFTYQGNEAGLVLIGGQGTIETTDKEEYTDTNGMMMKFDLSGTSTSLFKVDQKSGWIREATIEQNIGGDAFIKESDQMPQGMTIPMNLKNETRITGE